MKVYRLESLFVKVEGAYYTEGAAIVDLSNQLLLIDKCTTKGFKEATLKIKNEQKKFEKVKDLQIVPTKKEHWRTLEHLMGL